MNDRFKVGDRVIARHAIIEDATGDHPAFLMADAGVEMEVVHVDRAGRAYPIAVRLNGHDFGVNADEIRPAPAEIGASR